MTEDARREDSDGIVTITFIRDRKRNAVTLPMLEMLVQAGHDLANDDRRTARDVDRIAQTLLLTGPEYREQIEAFLARSPR